MPKRRANMSIDGDVLDVAKEHRLNVSAIAEAAIREAGKMAQAEAWKRDNAVALEQHRRRLDERGTLLGHLAAFQFEEENG